MTTLTTTQIKKIPISERILLAERIWDSIPENSNDIGLSESQMKELENRLNALENGDIHTVTWPQVKTKLRARRLCK